MRNLKKILALVLAMVMTFSVMATANAFTDDKDIDATYEEAVAVLNGLKVFKGYEDGSFQPKGNITRAEVAAIIYRVVTGDVNNAQVGIYADYNKFTDVKSTAWYAGYVNFCANAEYIKGYGDGTFGPNDQVTGYQALAMILRAIGYDKNGEFTGSNWQVQTAAVGKKLGVTDNVTAGTLGTAATREVVAEILFRTILVPQVDYTLAFGYTTIGNSSLGVETFGLTKGAASTDNWGRPCYSWTATKPAAVKGTVATITEKADATYYVATTECQIASDISLKANTEYTLYTNGKNNASKYVIQPLDTVQTLGGQGTLLEVYKDSKVVVSIDTFLAKVTNVTAATYDAAGHLKSPSRIDLLVYNTANGTAVYQTNKSTNYTYNKGDMVLVNAWTTNSVSPSSGAVTVNGIANTSSQANHIEILGAAETLVGAQTFIWYNNLKHTVNGTNYDDAKWFELDQAGTETTNHTWYFDSYGNLIGATDIATQYAYGIVENIQWINPVGEYGYAQATIRYMDGTTETKVVTYIETKKLTYTTSGTTPSFDSGTISTSLGENAAQCGNDLYRIETAADGTVKLTHVTHNDTVSNVTTSYKSELSNATIKGNSTLTALSAITGTAATGDSCNAIYTNSNTTFLVRTGTVGNYTYTVVKGYENVANYTATAKVDYVNLDGDSYADYVFITGTSDNATAYGMFYLTSPVVQAYLKTNGGLDYYELTGILDGAATTVKLDATATYWDSSVGYSTAVSTLTKADLEAKLAGYVNKMFVVCSVNGKVTAMYGPKADISNLYTETHNNVAYTNLALDYQVASTTAGTITKNGNVLYVNGVYYNILNNLTTTTNGYAWADIEDLSGKDVYVIYNTTMVLNGNTYVATAVYVADPASSIVPSQPSTSNWVGTGIDGYWSNATTKQIVTPAGATLTNLNSRYSGTATAVYTVANPAGEPVQVTVTTGNVDELLALGATITFVNANGTWTVID